MIKRCYPAADNKIRSKDLWDSVFATLSYDEYLATLNFDEPTEAIRQTITNLPRDSRILDIGCGGGRYLHMLAELGFTQLYGADLSLAGLEQAQMHIPNLNILKSDASRLALRAEQFDLILMVGVVYEIEDQGRHAMVFNEVKRLLRPDGSFVFVNNSPNNPGERFYTLTEKLKGRLDTGSFFVWRFSHSDVRALAAGAGLSVTSRRVGNFGTALFRFGYGIFVKQSVKQSRQQNLKTMNPYSLNELYLANRQPELFNLAGRLLFKVRRPLKSFFYNSEVYTLKRSGQS